jgi:hypothetical protein
MGNQCTACGCGDQPELTTELNTSDKNRASKDNLNVAGSNHTSQKSLGRPKNDVYSKGQAKADYGRQQ